MLGSIRLIRSLSLVGLRRGVDDSGNASSLAVTYGFITRAVWLAQYNYAFSQQL